MTHLYQYLSLQAPSAPSPSSTCKVDSPQSGLTFCEVIAPGETATFVAKDGNQGGCGSSVTSYVPGPSASAFSAVCAAPAAGAVSCGCVQGSQENECNWSVQAPATPCTPPAVSGPSLLADSMLSAYKCLRPAELQAC